MTQQPAPFSCTFTPSLPYLFMQLKCSIAITTYQAGKLILISPAGNDKLIQLPRTFHRPMGLSVSRNQLALATRTELTTFVNEPSLNINYQKTPTAYDAVFAPRITYHTGPLDLHDIHFSDNHLLAVATAFNCISKLTPKESFTPVWKPDFISGIEAEDRCHLNGFAILNNDWYVTAFNQGNTAGSWRSNILNSGVLIHAQSQELILNQLAIPHSPRIHHGKLYLLLSGKGELVEVDVDKKKYSVVCQVPAFVRGLAFVSHYAFIGISQPRKSSSTFGKLSAEAQQQKAGFIVVDLNTGNVTAELRYLNSVEEIYDVQIIAGSVRPNILSPDKQEHKLAVVSGARSWWAASE
jgi:uncharacterized protein (TIGR03032 family)